MLEPPCAPQPLSSNITISEVLGAGDLAPEGGVAAQAGIVESEHLDSVITLVYYSVLAPYVVGHTS